MNQTEIEHLQRVTEICANRGEAIELLGDKNIQLRAKIDEQAATIARLTAAHEMQGEELVTLPRHMVYSMEDKLKAQAAEIERLKNEIIRFSDLAHTIVSYIAAYNSPEREKESNKRIDMQLNAILKAAGMA